MTSQSSVFHFAAKALANACLVFLLANVFGLGANVAKAEPWLSTRYAQNCAGCHAPGRKNLEAPDRRCTLSCQACHVNPNGGGLRSGYGKWNENRWLRSFRSDLLRNDASFAPVTKQHYGRNTDDDKKGDDKRVEGRKRKKGSGKDEDGGDDEKGAKKKKRRAPKAGFPLVELANTEMNETLYKRDGREFSTVDRQEFMYNIPTPDPIRDLVLQKTDAGADLRYQIASLSRKDDDPATPDATKPRWSSFLMVADFAARFRPFYRKFHLVYEARIQGSPSESAKYDQVLISQGRTRSLYAMVDDLPFNVFVMGGYFRPLFGNYIPDHYALPQQMISYASSGQTRNYNLLYNAVSFGTAPNVPYLNVHLIRKCLSCPDPAEDKTEGFGANAGLRFVSFGASLNYSYWRTNDERNTGVTTGVEMHSLGAAGRLGRTVLGFDAISLSRDVDSESFRQGGAMTLDTFTQLWRENYFTALYSRANTTITLLPGKTDQIKAGVRSFVIPGLNLQLVYEITNETAKPENSPAVTTKTNGYTGQMHVYF